MESRGISCQNRPVIIKVGFLLESVSLTIRMIRC